MAAGANGFTISGAGPSVIAFSSDDGNLEEICSAMEKGFLSVPNAPLLYANLVLVPYVREVCKNVETKSSTCV